ncbi:MAG: hypothetical protein K1X54_14255 [Flavobacteriales bacterium]|nr:hypothetical protein [Flavobacteriales bacterium]
MKIITLLLFCFTTTSLFSQSRIGFDTLVVNYRIQDVVDITSYIPQIKGDINNMAKGRINADMKKYFKASIPLDSAAYVQELLNEYGLTTMEEFLEWKKSEFMADDDDESFKITYLSENLMNFTYSYQILPHGGRYQFFFESVLYDLQTGKKLEFDDFLTIERDSLISIFRKYGYRSEWQSDHDTPTLKVPIEENDAYVEDHIKYLFDQNGNSDCIDYYFTQKDNELQLMFKFQCAGPYLADYGISMIYLQPFITYSDFKNRYKLWGKDIYSLMGYDYLTLGNEIAFENYTITNSGSGFLLPYDNIAGWDEFGISICYSSSKAYYLFIKYQTVNDKRKSVITDILELDKHKLSSNSLNEFCETENGRDGEILALVKDTKGNPEYYTQVIKAWRANRKTGKFEPIKRNIVKRCSNETY